MHFINYRVDDDSYWIIFKKNTRRVKWSNIHNKHKVVQQKTTRANQFLRLNRKLQVIWNFNAKKDISERKFTFYHNLHMWKIGNNTLVNTLSTNEW